MLLSISEHGMSRGLSVISTFTMINIYILFVDFSITATTIEPLLHAFPATFTWTFLLHFIIFLSYRIDVIYNHFFKGLQ